jgi:hypothetical protein
MAAAHTLLLTQVDGWVAKILGEIVPDEGLTWQTAFQVLPDESDANAWLPILVVYVEMPLNEVQSFYSTNIMPPFVLNEDQLRQSLTAAVMELQGRRMAYLADQNGHVVESEVHVVTDLPTEG